MFLIVLHVEFVQAPRLSGRLLSIELHILKLNDIKIVIDNKRLLLLLLL